MEKLSGVCSVDLCCFQHIFGNVGQTCHIDNHQISAQLPYGNNDQGYQCGSRAGQPGFLEKSPAGNSADLGQCEGEDVVPDVTHYDTADHVCGEEAGTEESLQLDTVGQKQSQGQSKYITEHNNKKYIHKGLPQRRQEGFICKDCGVVGKTYQIIIG